MTLGQACPPDYRRAPCAFKDSMIHCALQFTLLIAFRCVLHRCQCQEIHCQKLLHFGFTPISEVYRRQIQFVWSPAGAWPGPEGTGAFRRRIIGKFTGVEE